MPIHFSSRPLLFTKATAPFASSCVHFSKIIEYSVNRAPRPKPRSPRRLNAPSAVFRSSGSRTASSSRSKPFMRTMPSCCAMRLFTHLSSGWPFVNRSTVIEPSPSPIANCARSPPGARENSAALPAAVPPDFPAAGRPASSPVATGAGAVPILPMQNAMAAVASQPMPTTRGRRDDVDFIGR